MRVEASGQGEAVAQDRAGVFPGVAAVAAEPDAALERAGDDPRVGGEGAGTTDALEGAFLEERARA